MLVMFEDDTAVNSILRQECKTPSTMKILVIVIFLVQAISASATFKRICYYSINNPVETNLPVAKINGTLCTHLLIGFASVLNSSVVLTRPSDPLVYQEAIELKRTYRDLIVMLSAGGGGEDSGFHAAVSTAEDRTRFTESVVKTLEQYEFDGFDIDWEFPAWQKHLEDRDNFILLLSEMHSAFKNRTRPLVLSVAVAPAYTIITASYDIEKMRDYVDFINLMTYDYHSYSWIFPFTEHNAPLYKHQVDEGYLATLNTNWSVHYWNQWGMSKDKIIVGIPTYSHSYVLLDPNKNGVGAPAVGTTSEFTYSQVCQFINQPSAKYVFDSEAQVPYAYQGLVWISFDDEKSVSAKANWIKANNFGGSMTYSLNCDDFNYSCSNTTQFVLQQLIYDVLK
ncbi:Acidic mammalian chitinase [Halotydeus destructor]|nr:Acidic mammalian chitinase [Halotydeus destructor]